jgi:hypothetical protein
MNDWLEDFRQTIGSSTARLLLISEEQSQLAHAEGKWSAKQVIGHLIDSAANNHQRFVRAQFSDHLAFPGYDQEAWVDAQRYNDEPWSQLVEFWRLYNLHLLHVMSNIPEAVQTQSRGAHTLDRIAWQTVAETEPVTLEYFMRDYVAHLQHHLGQILTAPVTQGNST